MKMKHCIPSTPIVGIGITVAAVVGAVERVVAEDWVANGLTFVSKPGHIFWYWLVVLLDNRVARLADVEWKKHEGGDLNKRKKTKNKVGIFFWSSVIFLLSLIYIADAFWAIFHLLFVHYMVSSNRKEDIDKLWKILSKLKFAVVFVNE